MKEARRVRVCVKTHRRVRIRTRGSQEVDWDRDDICMIVCKLIERPFRTHRDRAPHAAHRMCSDSSIVERVQMVAAKALHPRSIGHPQCTREAHLDTRSGLRNQPHGCEPHFSTVPGTDGSKGATNTSRWNRVQHMHSRIKQSSRSRAE